MKLNDDIVYSYNYVEKRYHDEALARLRERVAQGEDPFDILDIDRNNTYYVQKILDGHIRMSYELYDRIMGCSLEDM